MSLVYLAALLLYFLVSCLTVPIPVHTIVVGIAIVLQIFLTLFIYFKSETLRKKERMTFATCGVFGVLIMLLVIFECTYLYHNDSSMIFPLLLVCMCMIYTLPVLSSLLLPGISAVVFLLLSCLTKTPYHFYCDLIAVCIALLLGYCGLFSFTYYKVNEFQAKKRYEMLSKTDLPTGLNNKATFQNLCEEYCNTKAPEQSFALYVIDIDNFKQCNDLHGHGFGDLVISEVGKQLLAICPDTERYLLGRFGGDEFTVLVKKIDRPEQLEDEISDFMKKLCFHVSKELGKLITVSAGVSLCGGDCNFHEAFDRADRALLQAKKENKRGYVIVRE